ncbi:hypothetical protein N665_0160s0018 [Sinapis alba]|nr:hypothetical protein N665_0160s0018 [Sinapis alba]
MKSGFWQIQIFEQDKYKTTFTVAFVHYEWNVKFLPCLSIPIYEADMIVETDATEISYGGILKQKLSYSKIESIVRFHSGVWLRPQKHYSTVKKEFLSIVNCISKL